MLSKGGKEVLLKTVAQALPKYAMGVFLLPLNLCQDLEKMMCKFWWKTNSKKDRGIHWLSWSNMSKKKTLGGMGFRSVRDFNIRQARRETDDSPEQVSQSVFKARYYPQGVSI